MRIFLTDTTNYSSIRTEWQTFKPSDSGIKGLLNFFLIRWMRRKWRKTNERIEN